MNAVIHNKFSNINKKDIKRTHLFNGRYENIYIDKERIPELTPILEFANQCAKKTLSLSKNLDIGFWFNDMPPNSVTTAHTHDDYDEMLSGVYYVSVPQNAGNLVLFSNNDKKIVTPQEGRLILFKADCLHEVSINNSEQHRLSIGMNFGIKSEEY
ncbi:hypothetical protein MNBD_GAMMA23-62 [hydrothermal vent metagenome]|uniref:Fe2OG dioxygenase domain-containing protein n=1 Tax=hydrothermal vent metagenome TaxID=652676 RepID=A0A3B1AIY7_9ZZZZ